MTHTSTASEVARKIIHALNECAQSIADRNYHEHCIQEREFWYDDGHSELCTFDYIWSDIADDDLFEEYEELDWHDTIECQNEVRDLYPDWRHRMG